MLGRPKPMCTALTQGAPTHRATSMHFCFVHQRVNLQMLAMTSIKGIHGRGENAHWQTCACAQIRVCVQGLAVVECRLVEDLTQVSAPVSTMQHCSRNSKATALAQCVKQSASWSTAGNAPPNLQQHTHIHTGNNFTCYPAYRYATLPSSHSMGSLLPICKQQQRHIILQQHAPGACQTHGEPCMEQHQHALILRSNYFAGTNVRHAGRQTKEVQRDTNLQACAQQCSTQAHHGLCLFTRAAVVSHTLAKHSFLRDLQSNSGTSLGPCTAQSTPYTPDAAAAHAHAAPYQQTRMRAVCGYTSSLAKATKQLNSSACSFCSTRTVPPATSW